MSKPKTGLLVESLELPETESSNDMWRGMAHVFVKAQKTTGRRLILHEYLAARLANYLGLPVPFGEISSIPEGREAWVSGITSRDGKVLPPTTYESMLENERYVLCGVIAFDQWIFNGDRHEDNFVWSEDIGLWAIDHELAFCGDRDGDECIDWLKECSTLPLNMSHLARKGITDEDLDDWSSRIRLHGVKYAERAIISARKRGLLSLATAKAYANFLRIRSANIRSLTKEALKGNTGSISPVSGMDQLF
ncbi:HipA family kinase [Glutamicibacter sp. FR1]|uniref:HipA family kinase n=1 Tax=Glutamicibacter sp. FR1 TaxID=3393744 RepID=UPI0039B011BA